MKKALLVLLFSGALIAAGGGSSVGTGSPASLHCKKKGGVSTILYVGGSSVNGLCQFGQGGIAEWTLFRHSGGGRQIAAEEFLGGGSASCESRGGEIKRYTNLQKQTVKTCYFAADRSEIELRTLLGGPQSYPQLARALQ